MATEIASRVAGNPALVHNARSLLRGRWWEWLQIGHATGLVAAMGLRILATRLGVRSRG